MWQSVVETSDFLRKMVIFNTYHVECRCVCATLAAGQVCQIDYEGLTAFSSLRMSWKFITLEVVVAISLNWQAQIIDQFCLLYT